MAVRDFTLSYTTTPVLSWVENGEGKVGAATTIFSSIVNNFFGTPGPATTFDASQIITVDNVGAAATLFYFLQNNNNGTPGPAAGGISGVIGLQFTGLDIIQYNQSSLIKTDEITMKDVIVGTDSTGAWLARNVRTPILTVDANTTLDRTQSSTLVVNTTASGPIEITLPSPNGGLHYEFVTTSNNDMTIATNTSSIIMSGATGSGILMDSFGAKVSLMNIGSNWFVTKQFAMGSGQIIP